MLSNTIQGKLHLPLYYTQNFKYTHNPIYLFHLFFVFKCMVKWSTISFTKEHSRAKVVPNFIVSRQTILMFTFCLPSILKCSCQPLFVCFLTFQDSYI